MSLIVDNLLSTQEDTFSFTLVKTNVGSTFDYVASYRGLNIALNLTFMSIQEFEELFPEKQIIIDMLLTDLNKEVKFIIDSVYTIAL
jgi:hypothetical protein